LINERLSDMGITGVTINVYAVGGYTSFDGAPSDFPFGSYPNGTAPDTNNNITKAISDGNDLVLWMMGQNDSDVGGIENSEAQAVFNAVKSDADIAGVQVVPITPWSREASETTPVSKSNSQSDWIKGLGIPYLDANNWFALIGSNPNVLDVRWTYDNIHPTDDGVFNGMNKIAFETAQKIFEVTLGVPYLIDDRYQIGSTCVTVPAGEAIIYDKDTGEALFDKDTGQVLFDKDGV
jgi:hypothetical protein